MNRENLQGRYVITAVDCLSGTTLSPLQKSRIELKLDKNTPLDYSRRMGSLLISLTPYKRLEKIDFSQELSLKISDLDLKDKLKQEHLN